LQLLVETFLGGRGRRRGPGKGRDRNAGRKKQDLKDDSILEKRERNFLSRDVKWEKGRMPKT